MVLSVQYMRAIAALLVVLHHSIEKGAQYSATPMLGWFQIGGELGVNLFFVISGYIMCHATYNKKVDIKKFLKARVIRILPLYWVLTTVVLFIYLIAPGMVNSSGGTTSIIASYLLIPSESKYLVQNGWTLGFEFYFYIIFSLGLATAGYMKYIKPISLIVLLVLIGSLNHFDIAIIRFFTNQYLLAFVVGMVLFIYFQRYSINKTLSIIFIISAVVLSFWIAESEADAALYSHAFSVLFFIGMRGLEDSFINLQQSLPSKLFEGIGNSSYSLYLIHPFALVVVYKILSLSNIALPAYLFLLLLITLSLVAGQLCYLFLEKNLTKYFKGIEFEKRSLRLGGVR